MGRPTKQVQPRNKRLNIKLTENEYLKLSKCSELLKISRTDAIMLGIKKLLDEKQ